MRLRRFNVERQTDDSSEITMLKAEGYVPVRERTRHSAPDYSTMLKSQLIEIAEKRGLKTRGLRKDEIIKILEK